MNLADALANHRILAVRGPNFSGRTDLLRQFCDDNTHERGRIYIGPEVYNALSGLATSVRQEIELHAGAPLESCGVLPALRQFALTEHLDQNPALLSGGEQAALAVLCGLCLHPANLAIDCALEQLDSHRLAAAVSLLNAPDNPLHGSVITDNRIDEWEISVPEINITDVRPSPAPPAPVPPMNPSALAALAPISAPALSLRNITAGYPRRPAVLKDLTLTLAPGRVHILLGDNGAGKSTCAKILCGVLRPASGQILFDNQIADPSLSPGKVVGYHLQNPDVGLFESTVRAELGNRPQAPAVLDAFGLIPVAQANPLALPFPVRKRVSLAATIAAGQPWIFLDEPTLGADADAIKAIAEIATLLAASGRGVMIVSHSRAFRASLSAHEWLLENGRIKTDSSPQPA